MATSAAFEILGNIRFGIFYFPISYLNPEDVWEQSVEEGCME
jgi:hypothetical protein